MSAVAAFFTHEWHRLRFRLEVLWRAVVTAALWLGIATLHNALAGSMFEHALTSVLVALAFVGAPVLFVQLALLIDALSYLLYNEIRFYPRFMEMVREAAARRTSAIERKSPESARLRALVYVVDLLSPLSAPTTWVFLVLHRAPEAIYATGQPPARSVRGSARELRRIERTLVDRAWHRPPLRFG